MTNRSLSKRIIAAARAEGKLHELCYYVDMWMPRDLRPRPDVDHVPASWPPGFVPYIPLPPDEVIANDYAHILVALMESGNEGRGLVFRSELVGIDQLEATSYIPYPWGEDLSSRVVNKICPICGQVEKVFVGEKGTCCQPTRKRRPRPRPAYPLPHNAQFVGLHWWGGGEASADEHWTTVRSFTPSTEEVTPSPANATNAAAPAREKSATPPGRPPAAPSTTSATTCAPS